MTVADELVRPDRFTAVRHDGRPARRSLLLGLGEAAVTGLQRECPSCGELARPDGYVCLECGAWLVEPKHLEADELERVLGEWYRTDRPRRVDNPEQRQAEIREWDESREREQRERDRVSELWQRRRERWAGHRGDTGRGAAADTAHQEGTT